MIEIVRAPAHLQIQDAGFAGYRNLGLPRSGAMDQAALAAGNALVGNAPNDAALEWAVNGGTIRFGSAATVAVTGARVHGRIGQRMLLSNTTFEVQAGTVLEIDRFISGRFMYLCISPSVAVDQVFGSRSTYTPAKIGGFEGRRLRAGDMVAHRQARSGKSAEPVPSPNYSSSLIRTRPGPQAGVLNGRLLTYILNTSFTVSTASDRTGYRLDGPAADVAGLTQIVSEPACEGAIQITDGGTPIVLMADGPTIGGYNKVAVAVTADLPILAQKTPGESVRFSLV